MPRVDWSDDWGDFEYGNPRWADAADRGFPEWWADALDAHDVPPPDEWDAVTPIAGTWTFEIESGDGVVQVWGGGQWADWRHLIDEIDDWAGDYGYEVEAVEYEATSG